MRTGIRVALPPPKSLMIYDGDCDFCTLWIHRWRRMTGDSVDYLPAQDSSVPIRFPEISRGQFDNAVQLIETDGAVYSGAEAVLRALASHPDSGRQWLLRAYQGSPAFAAMAEGIYRFVAKHRTFLGRIAF